MPGNTLDVSLVRDIHDNLIQQELLLTLSRLAARIGAAVIAEGVESESEVAALIDGGAQYAQGYLFALPAARVWDKKTGKQTGKKAGKKKMKPAGSKRRRKTKEA